MPLTDLDKLVDDLMNDQDLREDYFENPYCVIADRGLSAAQRNVLMTLKRDIIAGQLDPTVAARLRTYKVPGMDPRRGSALDWTAAQDFASDPCRYSLSSSKVTILAAGGWPEPGAHAFTKSEVKGGTVRIQAEGEGLYPIAKIRLTNGNVMMEFDVAEIAVVTVAYTVVRTGWLTYGSSWRTKWKTHVVNDGSPYPIPASDLDFTTLP